MPGVSNYRAVQICGATSLIWMIWLRVFLFGLGIGNARLLPPTIAQVEFADADLARAVALVVAVSQATYAFGPLALGLLLSGSSKGTHIGEPTNNFFIAAGAVQILAKSLFLLGRSKAQK